MQQPELSSLYQELILEHYRHPRNKDELPERTTEVHVYNPVCGDEVQLQLRVENGRITAARFSGHGCSISQASVSMMTTRLEGKTLEEADDLATRFVEMMRGKEGAARDPMLGDLRALQGVARFPVRIKCALLGFDALREALEKSGLGPAPDSPGSSSASEDDSSGEGASP